MGEVAKQTLKQVSETMFPGISETYKNQNMHRKSSVRSYLGINKKSQAIKLGNEIGSDVPLQMALFFNVCYFPPWLIISIFITTVKCDHLNYFNKFVLVTVLIWAIYNLNFDNIYLTNKKPVISNYIFFCFSQKTHDNTRYMYEKYPFIFNRNSVDK